MYDGDDCAGDFQLSVYGSIPFQPPVVHTTSSNQMSLAQFTQV